MNKNKVWNLSVALTAFSYISATLASLKADSGSWIWLWVTNAVYAFIGFIIYENMEDR